MSVYMDNEGLGGMNGFYGGVAGSLPSITSKFVK